MRFFCLTASLLVVAGCGHTSGPDPAPAGPSAYVTTLGSFGSYAAPVVLSVSLNGVGSPTAISLPSAPNSMRMDASGSSIYLGSGSGLLRIRTDNTKAETFVPSATGPVEAISHNGRWVVAGDSLVDTTSQTAKTVAPGILQAAFSADDATLYFVTLQGLYNYSMQTGQAQPFPFSVAEVSGVLITGSGKYVAVIGNDWTVEVHASCDGSLVDSFSLPALAIAAVPSSDTLVSASPSSIGSVQLAANGTACNAPVIHTMQSASLPSAQTVLTNVRLAVTPNGKSAIMTGVPDPTGAFGAVVYDISGNRAQAVSLNGTTGTVGAAVTDDGKTAAVAGFDGLHTVDLATLQESSVIKLSIIPHLVVLK